MLDCRVALLAALIRRVRSALYPNTNGTDIGTFSERSERIYVRNSYLVEFVIASWKF